jgi:predicted DNA-binding protein with PD1-like motif
MYAADFRRETTMKSIELHEHDGLRTFLLVMDKGDEAFGEISEFARKERIFAASLTAIGACNRVKLGFFDPDISEYRYETFEEQLEIASCIGDIAGDNGEPALHAHIVLGRRDFSALAGHLEEIDVFPTMEVVLTETPAHLRKRYDPQTGLTLIAPGDSTAGN